MRKNKIDSPSWLVGMTIEHPWNNGALSRSWINGVQRSTLKATGKEFFFLNCNVGRNRSKEILFIKKK